MGRPSTMSIPGQKGWAEMVLVHEGTEPVIRIKLRIYG